MPSRNGIRPTVFVNGAEDPALEVLSIERSAGGKRLDHCKLAVNLARDQRHLDGFRLTTGMDPEVEVRATVNGQQRIWFWGKVKRGDLEWEDHEDWTLTAQIDPCHFGDPIA